MNPKKVISAALLAFVAASVLYLVFGQAGRSSTDAPEGLSQNKAARKEANDANVRVTAYYFHGTARCRTCLAIESTAREVLESEFPDDFATGAIRWRAVNFEQLENEHFAKEFQLTGASLVLVKEVGGRPERWDKLEQVWELIGDDVRFSTYVLDQARSYLKES
jgi:hypothetical protein